MFGTSVSGGDDVIRSAFRMNSRTKRLMRLEVDDEMEDIVPETAPREFGEEANNGIDRVDRLKEMPLRMRQTRALQDKTESQNGLF